MCARSVAFLSSAVVAACLASRADADVLYALSPSTDVLRTPEPVSQKAWDATGDGNEELMAFDALTGKLLALATKIYDGRGDLGLQVGVYRTFSSGLGDFGTLFTTDMDGDGEDDLVLATDGSLKIWNGGVIRAEDGEHPPDSVVPLPPGLGRSRIWLEPADLNGDGSPDFVYSYHNLSEAEILTGFDTEDPRIVPLTAGFDRETDGFANPQLVRNWDGAGTVVLALEGDGGNTIVYSFDESMNAQRIDEVPVRGLFAHLRGDAPPEFVKIGFLANFGDPIATVYQKTSGQWIPEELAEPVEPIDFGGNFFTPARFGKVTAAGSSRESIYFARESGPGDYYRIVPGIGSDAPTLHIEKGDPDFPPAGFSALRLPNRSEELLAIRSYRTGSTDPSGTLISGVFLSLVRPDAQGLLKDIYSLPGSIGRCVLADIDDEGTTDLVSIRRGDSGVTVFYQSGKQGLAETVTYPAGGSGSAERLVKGDFNNDGKADLAISHTPGIWGIPTYSPTPQSLLPKGAVTAGLDGFWPGRAMGGADFSGDGADDLLFIDGYSETLRYTTFDEAGARHGGRVIALAGQTRAMFPAPLPGSAGNEETYLTPSQVLIVDADGDGDQDIITFPSALGAKIALHRNEAGVFSVEPLSDTLETDAFGNLPAMDGVPVTPPSHLFAGKFLSGAGGMSLLSYGNGSDIFGNPISSATVFEGSLVSPVALANIALPQLGTVLVADFDQDGLDDLLGSGGRAQDLFGNLQTDLSIYFFRSRGDGTFDLAVTLGRTRNIVSQLLAEDMDGDGVIDVIAVSEESNSIEFFGGQALPFHPSFSDWAATHTPDMPGFDDTPDAGGNPNLILFSSGKIPSGSAGAVPFPPPSESTITWSGTFLEASHPIPRLGNGESVEVRLQYSYDLLEWTTAPDAGANFENDSQNPQWLTKKWRQVFPQRDGRTLYYSPEALFYRFEAEYHSR